MSCGCKKSCSGSCSCSSSCAPTECDPCSQVCTALQVSNSWNVPACDAYAVLYVPGITTVLIGSYISNPTYGTFKITSINSTGGKITIQNECLAGNAAPGTVVPAFTEFVFGTPPTLTEYSTWVPVVTASGAMTVSALVIAEAAYFTIGTTCFFSVEVGFTLGGVADIAVYISNPIIGVSIPQSNIICAASENSTVISGGARWRSVGTNFFVSKHAAANWTLGANANIAIQGNYQI